MFESNEVQFPPEVCGQDWNLYARGPSAPKSSRYHYTMAARLYPPSCVQESSTWFVLAAAHAALNSENV
ncbi:hypothetical protein E2C01_049989 [Portunus trituberculatus]|uniref:Uncharacterized protein n=1 Tax=Portunus trituberculatus TaxID=210409 RepID=A0A5B7G728_PORTR|nr:hypothetical protein [Portunus trituberculatus]